MKVFFALAALAAALCLSACEIDDGVNRPHNTPVTYGGQIAVAQGQNQVNTTGPIVNKESMAVSISNTGSQPMLVNDIIGEVISNDNSLTVDVWIERATGSGSLNVGRQLSVAVNNRTTIGLNNLVLQPNETIVLRVFMTSQAASTGDMLQFLLHEVNSSGGRFIPPGNPPRPLQGPSFLAG